MKKHFSHIARDIGVFIAVIVLLWGFLMLTSLIPNKAIYDNMMESASQLNPDIEDVALEYEGQKWNTFIDYYADSILTQIAWNMGNGNAVKSSVDTNYFDGERLGVYAGLQLAIIGVAEPNVDYSRYWHGTAGFIRLFHLFTDINGIKAIGFSVIMILALAVILLLCRKKQYAVAIVFLLSLIAVKIWVLLYCIEYQPAFAIGLLMCVLFLLFEKKGDNALFTLSVLSGTLIAFFDFLTTETLAILLPLIFVVLVRTKEDRLGEFKPNVSRLFFCGLRFVMAYGATFLAKWSIASIITGENKFALAFSSAGVRFAGEITEIQADTLWERIYSAILSNFSMLFNATKVRIDVPLAVAGICISLLVIGLFCYIFHKENNYGVGIKLLLLLGSVVIARFVIMNNHSILHMLFTYRALVSTMVAVFGAVILSVSKGKIKDGK
ncbi:MAG: hypothetical protein IJA60_03275 [Clostridia bacterium]|nr:hypothetical protein [Clostridia bacterium]